MSTNVLTPALPVSKGLLYTSADHLAAGTVRSGEITGLGVYNCAEFTVEATIAGTTTVNVYIQKKLPNGDFDDIMSFTQITTTGKKTMSFIWQLPTADHAPAIETLTAGSIQKCLMGDTIRVVLKVAGAAPDAGVKVYGAFYCL